MSNVDKLGRNTKKGRGPASIEDIKQMKQMSDDGMSVGEISEHFGRRPTLIRKYINEGGTYQDLDNKEEIIKLLKTREFYKDVKKQLNKDELKSFENQWADLVLQFQGQDITASEEMTMKTLILTDIDEQRDRILQRKIINESDMLDVEIESVKGNPEEDQTRIYDLQQRKTTLMANVDIVQKRLQVYTKQKSTLMKDLKATRDARLSKVEDSTKNIFSKLKYLDDPKIRRTSDEDLILMRLALARCREKLTQTIRFADDSHDKPFLTSKIVEKEKQEQEKLRQEEQKE